MNSVILDAFVLDHNILAVVILNTLSCRSVPLKIISKERKKERERGEEKGGREDNLYCPTLQLVDSRQRKGKYNIM